MWTPTTRAQHSRENFRYQTDLTDAEWAVIAPHLPCEQSAPWTSPWRAMMIVQATCSGSSGHDKLSRAKAVPSAWVTATEKFQWLGGRQKGRAKCDDRIRGRFAVSSK